MASSLTIFIDALPFDQLEKMPFSRGFKSRARLIPILGYSVNCQTQLFTGQTPDEIGFWCEWQYDPEHSPFRRLRALLAAASPLEKIYYAKRVVHKVLDRLGWVSCTKNIPFRLLPDFVETGHSVFNQRFFDHPSLLDSPKLKSFLHLTFPVVERRDEDAVRATLDHIESHDDPGNLLITLTRLDSSSHWDGVDSERYDVMLARNDGYIRDLTEAFLKKVPDGTVRVVSDHGMSNIEHQVKTDLEGEFGPPKPSTYAYFTEGTIMRVWCRDEALRERIAAYLDAIAGIERYSDEERRHDGITRREFGDLIYHSHEGHQFVPSFWGHKPSVGMHGHHPRYRSQHGLCLSTREGEFEGDVRAPDFYRVLADQLAA
jgi:predicted AlkP superfamily pyrophosphatase or phosphodiesterase